MAKWTVRGPHGSFNVHNSKVLKNSVAHKSGAEVGTYIAEVRPNVIDVCGFTFDQLAVSGALHVIPSWRPMYLFLKPGITPQDFDIIETPNE